MRGVGRGWRVDGAGGEGEDGEGCQVRDGKDCEGVGVW